MNDLRLKCQQKIEFIQQLETKIHNNELELEEAKKLVQNERMQTSHRISTLEKENNRLETQCNQLAESVLFLI